MTARKTQKRDVRLASLIEEATVDCYGPEEELMGLWNLLDEQVDLPFQATVVGVPLTVSALEIDDTNILVAVCEREGRPYRVPVTALEWTDDGSPARVARGDDGRRCGWPARSRGRRRRRSIRGPARFRRVRPGRVHGQCPAAGVQAARTTVAGPAVAAAQPDEPSVHVVSSGWEPIGLGVIPDLVQAEFGPVALDRSPVRLEASGSSEPSCPACGGADYGFPAELGEGRGRMCSAQASC
jgi:hypothetical protein